MINFKMLPGLLGCPSFSDEAKGFDPAINGVLLRLGARLAEEWKTKRSARRRQKKKNGNKGRRGENAGTDRQTER